jgi:hypothetical protein
MIDRLMKTSRLVTLACGLALGLSLPGDAVAQRQEAAPQVLTEVGIDEQLGGQIPLDLRFRDENGRASSRWRRCFPATVRRSCR